MDIKQALLNQCKLHVESRLTIIQQTISSHQKALNSEVKSTAGDKHETGRSMLHLEIEKAGKQLFDIQQMKKVLTKIDVSKTTTRVSLGTLVQTSEQTYFLSIPSGKHTVKGNDFFAISIKSPIGKQMLGKQKGDFLFWNGKKTMIKKIS